MCGVARESVLLNDRQQDDIKQPFIAVKKNFIVYVCCVKFSNRENSRLYCYVVSLEL